MWSKLCASKVLVVALVLCCLVPLGSADTSNEMALDDTNMDTLQDNAKNEEEDVYSIDGDLETSIEPAETLEVGEGGACDYCNELGDGSCTGTNSCRGAGNGGTAKIGKNSCTALGSCESAGNGGTATIGDNSCRKDISCYWAGEYGNATIGNNSCTHRSACLGVGQHRDGTAKIGDSSCTGKGSCLYAGRDGDATIGDNSCTGEDSCPYAGRDGDATIGDNSCTALGSCESAGRDGDATIGKNSCTALGSCESAGNGGTATIGDNSCRKVNSCYWAGEYGNATIGDNSCTGTNSCKDAGRHGRATIGKNSCRGVNSCDNAGSDGDATIGMNSCTGKKSCKNAGGGGDATIGDNSCTGEESCLGIGAYGDATIGDNSCTVLRGCVGLRGDMPNGCPSIAAKNEGKCDGDDGDYCRVNDDCNVGLSCGNNGICLECAVGPYAQYGCPCESSNDCADTDSYCFNEVEKCGHHTDCQSGIVKHCIKQCMAGKTGLTKVEKVLDSVILSHVVQVQDLEVGDRVLGIDENMTAADECEVVSVTSTGNGTVYGNYTSDHYVLASGELATETNITVHGEQADASPVEEQLYQVLSSCPLVTDETGKQATFSICGASLYGFGPMPWRVYLKIHMTMFNLVKTSGIRDLSAFANPAHATDHLPSLCASGLACADDAGDCTTFEEQMLEFIHAEMTPGARKKALVAFPNLGDATKVGSVSYLVSMGKSAAAIASLE